QLKAALAGRQPLETVTKPGKQSRYGVGAIATLKHGPRLLFFLAYTQLNLQNKAESTPDTLWKSLLALWEEVSIRGNGEIVSLPVFGGGLARLSSLLPAQDAIRFTVLSFMIASRTKKVCDELRIVVRPEDYAKLDRLELQSFLSSLRAS
ncbi:macro domain-containing protein, partial [Ideonella sp.]|uniref:macro domain-containing protein n=1 Tax=Ideonella sp. TaxID=1929293 RepID=UPI002B494323